MTIGITAAGGQLGHPVIAKLKAKVPVSEIVALARNPPKAAYIGVAVREADYARPETLGPALAGVDTLLVEQPTRGVDVGAKAEIYALLREFVDNGGTVLAVSSDLPELIGLCDRILMVRGGAIVGNVPGSTATEESLLALVLADAPSAPAVAA